MRSLAFFAVVFVCYLLFKGSTTNAPVQGTFPRHQFHSNYKAPSSAYPPPSNTYSFPTTTPTPIVLSPSADPVVNTPNPVNNDNDVAAPPANSTSSYEQANKDLQYELNKIDRENQSMADEALKQFKEQDDREFESVSPSSYTPDNIPQNSSAVNPNDQYVNGYYRSNGTYVAPYHRTAPNSTRSDNYSTAPNINPYTGRTGTRHY